MTWWQLGAAGLLLKGAAALTLVPDVALPALDSATPAIVVEVRCEPAGPSDATGAGLPARPVICHEEERAP